MYDSTFYSYRDKAKRSKAKAKQKESQNSLNWAKFSWNCSEIVQNFKVGMIKIFFFWNVYELSNIKTKLHNWSTP